MSKIEEIKAQIRADLSSYDAAGLIDDTSLNRDVRMALRRFGNKITQRFEKTIEIEEGKAKLPENFYSLYVAFLCERGGYSNPSCMNDIELKTNVYVKRQINNRRWSECDPCCEETSESVIKETVYVKGNPVQFRYKNPKLLRLGKTMHKDMYASDCRNKFAKESDEEIMISNGYMHTNFKEGIVYFQYNGFTLDEYGDIDIPETKNGNIETYILYHLKDQIAERLIANGDAKQGLSALKETFERKAQTALLSARNELARKAFSPRNIDRLQTVNKLDSLQYELDIQYQWR